jgi:hypothetical protein
LVEMGDFDGAVCHLSKLSVIPFQFQQLRLQRAILWLQLGDVEAARRCVVDDSDSGKIVLALGDMADGKYAEAAEAWKKLCESDKTNSLYSQNLAVCLLYSGLMAEVCLPFKLLFLDSFNKSIKPARTILIWRRLEPYWKD